MRALLYAAAVAAASVPAAGLSQTVPTDPMGASVNLTAQENMRKRGFPIYRNGSCVENCDPSLDTPERRAQVQATLDAMNAEFLSVRDAAGVGRLPGPTTNPGWMAALLGLDIPQGLKITNGNRDGTGFVGGGGSYGGGGAKGSWDYEGAPPCDFNFRLDVDGNLIIPSVPLPNGVPHTPEPHREVWFWYTTESWISGSSNYWQSVDYQSLALWYFHNFNKFRGGDKRRWYGVWRCNNINTISENCDARTVGYLDSLTGVKYSSESKQMTWTRHDFYAASAYHNTHMPCPVDPSAGGSFHYYSKSTGGLDKFNNGGNGCTAYSPNYAISASGYFYPEETVMPKSHIAAWPRSLPDHIRACQINPELIRQITDKLAHRASGRTPYNGTPYDPIKPEDVRIGDKHPRADDFHNAEDMNTSVTGGSNQTSRPPEAGTSPEPDDDGGFDLGPDPGIGAPTLDEPNTGIMDPIFDWLPDLPSITLGDYSSNCPTFALNLTEFGGPEWQWVMDVQCEIFENNRAAISALMVALWGMAAALIILRA